jgi:hypothetical protein
MFLIVVQVWLEMTARHPSDVQTEVRAKLLLMVEFSSMN